ncbi:MAG: hypothetical protein PF542_02030 [Nanoarchaeota archaeon]|jgi:hypothetical protein|nr:hypothetical protein [Nanoarchaeota archaeon]
MNKLRLFINNWNNDPEKAFLDINSFVKFIIRPRYLIPFFLSLIVFHIILNLRVILSDLPSYFRYLFLSIIIPISLFYLLVYIIKRIKNADLNKWKRSQTLQENYLNNKILNLFLRSFFSTIAIILIIVFMFSLFYFALSFVFFLLGWIGLLFNGGVEAYIKIVIVFLYSYSVLQISFQSLNKGVITRKDLVLFAFDNFEESSNKDRDFFKLLSYLKNSSLNTKHVKPFSKKIINSIVNYYLNMGYILIKKEKIYEELLPKLKKIIEDEDYNNLLVYLEYVDKFSKKNELYYKKQKSFLIHLLPGEKDLDEEILLLSLKLDKLKKKPSSKMKEILWYHILTRMVWGVIAIAIILFCASIINVDKFLPILKLLF